MNSSEPPLLIVSGPTASGKSTLAISLAQALDGEIVSVDSAQVYKHFSIGTDKIPPTKRQDIIHHCLDFLEPDEQCNAFVWLKEASKRHAEVRGRGRLPIYAGGSTLYISAMVSGLDALPSQNKELRAQLSSLDTASLFSKAQSYGVAETINPNDRTRLIRALEIKSASEATRRESWPSSSAALLIVLVPERELLYKRINKRVEEMFSEGLLLEARQLFEMYGAACPAFRTVGYSQCARFFKGELSEAALMEDIAKASRRYAKRQLTFWRNEPRKRHWVQVPGNTGHQGDSSKCAEIKSKEFSIPALIQLVSKRVLSPIDSPEVWYITVSEPSV